MSEHLALEEFTKALVDLPPEFKAQLATVIHPPEEIDTATIKFELVKFVTELRKHNQGVDWETNKMKPKQIRVNDIIEDSETLFNFITE